jgi:hypothetical protein
VSRRKGGFGGFEANIGFAVLVLGNLYGDDQANASLPIKSAQTSPCFLTVLRHLFDGAASSPIARILLSSCGY